MADALRKAVFLDRDKTLIADPGYINSPDMVELLPGAAAAVKRLNAAGYVVIVATNQSGVARGLITEDQLAEVHERLRELLLEQGARLDAIYCCPYLDGPDAIVAEYRQASPLRKPEAGMLLQAAEDLELDLEQSWMIGDSARDVHAGKAAGARTILIAEGPSDAPADYTCRDLESAVATVLAPASTLRSRPPAAFVPTQPAPQTGPDLTEVAGLLTEIRDMLRRKERASQHEDFSVARLIGTLAQMLALVAAAWGIAALLGRPEAAAPRVLLAVFLQLAALTAFMSERR